MLEFYSDALLDAMLNHYEVRTKEQNETMAEYISKDRAKHLLCEHCNEVCPDEPCEPEECDWMYWFDKEPAAAVAPVRQILWETQDKIIDEKRFRWAYRIREARGNE